MICFFNICFYFVLLLLFQNQCTTSK